MTLLGLLLFGVVWLMARGRDPVARYSFRIGPDLNGRVAVDLVVEGRPMVQLGLIGFLDDQRLSLRDLRVSDERGNAVETRAVPQVVPASGRTQTRYDLIPDRPTTRFEVRYTIRPGVDMARNGDPGQVQLGCVGPRGATLALANLALGPTCRLQALEIETSFPEGWHSMLSFPGRIEPVDDGAWWSHAWVATAGAPVTTECGAIGEPDVTVVRAPDVPVEVTRAAERIVRELRRAVGPPRSPVEIRLTPGHPGRPVVELPSAIDVAVVDANLPDVRSLRRLIRQVVPLWFASSASEVEYGAGRSPWFLLGLCEYLALVLPPAAGLVQRDAAAEMERAWVSEPSVRATDVRRAPEATPGGRRMRRLAAAVWIHELTRRNGDGGGLRTLVQTLEGSGGPSPLDEGARGVLATFLRGRDAAHAQPFSFESSWRTELCPRSVRTDLGPVVNGLELAFTADTHGALEPCGCKLGAEGGMARIAAAVHRLRRALGDAMPLFDLGNFSPIKAGDPDLGPKEARDFAVYLQSMGMIRYDAITVASQDLAAGVSRLNHGLPLLGVGVGLDGHELFPASKSLEYRGIRIGYIAYSESVEIPILREAHEPGLHGSSFPTGPEALLAAVARLGPDVELLIVGGRMKPSTLHRVCSARTGIDLVLLGGYAHSDLPAGPTTGFLGETAVSYAQGSNGLNRITLMLTEAMDVVGLEAEFIELPESEPTDPGVVSLLQAVGTGQSRTARGSRKSAVGAIAEKNP